MERSDPQRGRSNGVMKMMNSRMYPRWVDRSRVDVNFVEAGPVPEKRDLTFLEFAEPSSAY